MTPTRTKGAEKYFLMRYSKHATVAGRLAKLWAIHELRSCYLFNLGNHAYKDWESSILLWHFFYKISSSILHLDEQKEGAVEDLRGGKCVGTTPSIADGQEPCTDYELSSSDTNIVHCVRATVAFTLLKFTSCSGRDLSFWLQSGQYKCLSTGRNRSNFE
jgi:hypothetical protein